MSKSAASATPTHPSFAHRNPVIRKGYTDCKAHQDKFDKLEKGKVYQGVGMPASGSCADVVTDASVNLSGVPGTGWTKSWAKWANGGAGGDVCVRTLVYVANTKSWAVAK